MEVNINNRMVLIVGPSSTGKTTLARKIKQEFDKKAIIISHDETLKRINRQQPQEKIDLEYRLTLIKEIYEIAIQVRAVCICISILSITK